MSEFSRRAQYGPHAVPAPVHPDPAVAAWLSEQGVSKVDAEGFLIAPDGGYVTGDNQPSNT